MKTKTVISFTKTGLAGLILLIITLGLTSNLGLSTSSRGASIIAFGDSITRGWGSKSGGYPEKLNHLLNSNGQASTVANMGIDGEKTIEGVNRIDSALTSFPADIILIMEGTNDILRGVSMETSAFNLQEMISKAKLAGVTPILATLPPVDWRKCKTDVALAWNPTIKSLADKNGILLSDQYTAILPSWDTANIDKIHPNDKGYQIIANAWYSTITSLIAGGTGY